MALKYITLGGEKKVHIYAESEFTQCGIPVPINSGATWTEDEPDKVCDACTAVSKTSEKAAKKSTIYSTSHLGDISPDPRKDDAAESAPQAGEVVSSKGKTK